MFIIFYSRKNLLSFQAIMEAEELRKIEKHDIVNFYEVLSIDEKTESL